MRNFGVNCPGGGIGRRGLIGALVCAVACAALSSDAAGQPLCTESYAPGCTLPPHWPQVCIGFLPPAMWGRTAGLCPPGYAFYGVDDPSGNKWVEAYPIVGTCCPLPAPDILTGHDLWTPFTCPHNYVATGADNAGWITLLRCTKINTSRYALEVYAHPYMYWGKGDSGYGGAVRIHYYNIPPGIRYAHGRTGYDTWDVDGCVASINERSARITDWGGLLTARTGKSCATFFFKRLLFAGLPGDPPAGAVVPLFPRCFRDPAYGEPFGSCPGAPPPPMIPPPPCAPGTDCDDPDPAPDPAPTPPEPAPDPVLPPEGTLPDPTRPPPAEIVGGGCRITAGETGFGRGLILALGALALGALCRLRWRRRKRCPMLGEGARPRFATCAAGVVRARCAAL